MAGKLIYSTRTYNDTIRTLKEMPTKLQRNVLAAGYREALKPVLRKARRSNLYTSRTGTLKKSLKIKTSRKALRLKRGSKGQVGAVLTVGDRKAEYGFIVHHGQPKRRPPTKARPFLTEALVDSRHEIQRSFMDGIIRRFRRIVR